MECVTTTSFSLSINGTLHGYFKGKRGLRQGDPLSPYLFTLIMEVLTLMLRRKVRDSDGFRYHRYCSDLEIINLCFADDLFIFAHGDPYSAKVIMEAMEEFKNASGLTPSLPKSTAYFCNVLNHTKLSILQILPFEEGRLPVKYLGVPLVSSRLVFRDCKELVDRIRSRINDWKNKSLSAAGRLQLVRSVLGSMHVYWASVFILPSRILLDIEQLMRGFLWCHGEMKKGRAKFAWEVVYLLKNEGGLEDHFRFRIGDGATCSLWFDRWSTSRSLAAIVSNRDIHMAGFYFYSKVKDAVHNGEWSWPTDWFSKYPLFNSVAVPTLSAMQDRLEWRDRLEIVKPFSVNAVWNYIQPRDAVVNWYDMVWFADCIPSHAFHLWLVDKRRLKTQDLLRMWDVNGAILSMHCPLCDGQLDSHEHLFFDCVFSKQIWDSVKSLVGLPNVIGSISIIVDLLIPFAKRRSAQSVVAKLVMAACSYYIWQERNLHLFMNQKRSHSQVTDCIKSSIRLKLLSCTFKKSKDALLFKRLWNLPDSIFRECWAGLVRLGDNRAAAFRRIRVGSWNVGSLTGELLELVDALERNKVDMACFQETKWKGFSNKEGNGYKLWYLGYPTARNGVGVILKACLKEKVVNVNWCSDRIISLTMLIDGETVNVISAYAPQVGLSEVGKKTFWDSLDKREGSALPRILWKNLIRDATEAFRSKVAEGVSTQVEVLAACDADFMWNILASIIKDAAKDNLDVAIGTSKTHTARRESWWLCEEVQLIVAVKQVRFRELLSCREGNKEERLRVHERGIKLLGRTMKLWERVIERRLRRETSVSENQFDFMPERSSVEAIHLIRSLMEKYRERQRDLHMVFLDLEKSYDIVPRELIWKTLVDKGTPRRYIRAIRDMYDGVKTRVRTSIRNMKFILMEVGLH
ncbi:hypothetical protein Tco_0453421 [Tanacetum coccineum]